MFTIMEATPYNCTVQYCQECDSIISVNRECHTIQAIHLSYASIEFSFNFVSDQLTLLYLQVLLIRSTCICSLLLCSIFLPFMMFCEKKMEKCFYSYLLRNHLHLFFFFFFFKEIIPSVAINRYLVCLVIIDKFCWSHACWSQKLRIMFEAEM